MTDAPSGSSARFITPSSAALKVRLLSGNADAPLIDPWLVGVAEKKLSNLRDEFPVWALGQLAALKSDVDVSPAAHPLSAATLAPLISTALNMRGVGTTMGYPLVTHVATSLLSLLTLVNDAEEGSILSRRWREAIRVHIEAMEIVVRDRVRGDGGEIGKRILHDFTVLLSKTTAVEPD